MPTNPLPQLWTNEEIQARYKDAFGKFPDVHHWAFLCWMRDDYQRHIANLEAQLRVAETGLARLMADAERDGELLDMYEEG